MNLHKLNLTLVFIFITIYSQAQVNFLVNQSWDKSKLLAKQSGKPIFIDVYTTWCGPCKKMDKTTFQDSTITQLMNNNFINLKIDAEKKEYEELVKNFEINAYPSFVFTDSDGVMLTKEVGYKTKTELEILANKFLSIVDGNVLSKLNSANIENFTDSQLDSIVANFHNYNLDIKNDIKAAYYKRLDNGIAITNEAYEFLLQHYEVNDNYLLLIENPPSDININNIYKWNKKFTQLFEKLYSSATSHNDENEFKKISNCFVTASNGTLKQLALFNNPKKEIKVRKLDFYKHNKYYVKYIQISDTLINEYIKSLDPESLKLSDNFMFNTLKSNSNQFESNDTTELSARDSLEHKSYYSLKMAKRLNGIVEFTVKNINDEFALGKAADWIDLSLTFIDLPESHLLKAAVLRKLGMDNQSMYEIEIAQKSPYFNNSCIQMAKKLNLE